MKGLDPIAHSLFWSLLANIGAYVCVSLMRPERRSRRARRPCSWMSSSRAGRPAVPSGAVVRRSATCCP
jgi:hypothetical protein